MDNDHPIRIIIDAGETETDPKLENLFDFMNLQTYACLSVREFDPSDVNLRKARWARCKEQIEARSAHEVWIDASLGNPGGCLELGLRMYTGCGATKDKNGALDWWRRIADPTSPNLIKSASGTMKARALSCLAKAYLDNSFPSNKLHLPNLYRASRLANASASFGLVTSITVQIASKVEKIGLRRQADCRFKEVDTSCFEALQFLWKSKDTRDEELRKRRETRDIKVSQTPNLYLCAAEGCGIEGTSRSGLLQCSGKCPPVGKPSYCSKECQKADWKRHRIVCNGEAKDDSIIAMPPPKPIDETIGANLRNDDRELTIEVPAPGFPGGKFLLSSTILSPPFMRLWRDSESEVEEEKARR